MKTHADVIKELGGATALASLIEQNKNKVQQWRNRNSIPPAYFADIVHAARCKRIKLGFQELHAMAKESQS